MAYRAVLDGMSVRKAFSVLFATLSDRCSGEIGLGREPLLSIEEERD